VVQTGHSGGSGGSAQKYALPISVPFCLATGGHDTGGTGHIPEFVAALAVLENSPTKYESLISAMRSSLYGGAEPSQQERQILDGVLEPMANGWQRKSFLEMMDNYMPTFMLARLSELHQFAPEFWIYTHPSSPLVRDPVIKTLWETFLVASNGAQQLAVAQDLEEVKTDRKLGSLGKG
jgi:hypothetical protein